MNTCRTIAIRLGIAFLFLLFSTPLWAGDCSGPDDCGSIPDNTTGAAGIAGAGAGIAVATGMKKKDEEEEPTLGEGEASDLDTLFGSADSSGGADAGSDSGSSKPRPDPGELGVEGPPSKPHSGPPDGPLGE